MSKNDKIIERFKNLPKDFTFDEMEKLHKPHPGNIIKDYALKQVYEILANEGLI